MYIANPKTSITPAVLDCTGTADITLGFQAGSAFYANPAEIILLIDRSAGISSAEMDAVKTAAKQFITDLSLATVPTPIYIGSQSSLWISSFADTVITNKPMTSDVAPLQAAVDAIQISSSPADYKAAFEAAEALFLRQTDQRHIVVLFSHSAGTALADADPVVEQMKARGVEFFCIGLLDEPAKLNRWASDAAKDHVSWTNSSAGLQQAFREITAEVVLAGVLDGHLTETVGPDFQITGYDAPTDGTVQLTGTRTLTWTIPQGALAREPVKPALTFHVRHIGTDGGTKEVLPPAVYGDRYGNTLDFPGAQVEVDCTAGGSSIWPDPCPAPTEFAVEGCLDSAHVVLSPISLRGLGRIVQMDVVLKDLCPNKRAAVSIVLHELSPDGAELPRGVKHFLIPAQPGDACQDLTLKCVQFSLPETLDAANAGDSLCNPRKFGAQVIANYVDTDFTCCAPVVQTP